ncbi:MAG: alpha-ketoacid dehydrogenase subunit alpha/beta [Christensenellales bacterium]
MKNANEMFYNPEELRKPGEITFEAIKINQYQKQVKDETKNFSADEFIGMYKDMYTIRTFEEMLTAIKTHEEYEGMKHFHAGPVHPAIGQEAVSVGMCFLLKPEDYMFGAHRSHGDVLAKGFSSIRQLNDEQLLEIMENFNNGKTFKVIQKIAKTNNVKEMARFFMIYGMAAEIFAKDTGFNRSLGGSMHAFFVPFGILPNNAIVGGSIPLATGAALFRKIRRKPGVIVVTAGDASLGCGPVYEAFNFAAMKQYTSSWDEEFSGGLPIIYNVTDNMFGMGARTKDISMGYDMPARLGAGIVPNQMYAERIDGMNPLAVIDAYRRKLQRLKDFKECPVLLDVLCYRLCGHSTADAQNYRSKEEVEAWRQYDPIQSFRRQLIENKLINESDIESLEAAIKEQIVISAKAADSNEISPMMDMKNNPDLIANLMLSNKHIEKFGDDNPEVLGPKNMCSRVEAIAKKERFYLKDSQFVSQNKGFQLRDALFEAIIDKFYKDPSFVFYGEDVRDWGGAQAVSRGLMDVIAPHRFFNTPISEAAIVGTACGYALSGGRALVELMYCDFMTRCADEIFNQLAKWQSMSAGILKMPVVVRCTVGARYGAQHAQDWTGLVSHIPGLKVVFPVTPYDAKGLLTAALNGTDPVIFFESQKVYDKQEMFHEGGVPEGSYEIPIGEPDIKRKGNDITILTIGATLYTALEAARELEEKYGMSAEVIDSRSLVPFNYEPVIESVKKTGKLLLAGDAVTRGSFMNTLAQKITEFAFDYLDAPPIIVASRNWISPAAEFEQYYFPQVHTFFDAIHEKIAPLKNYKSSGEFSSETIIKREKAGV